MVAKFSRLRRIDEERRVKSIDVCPIRIERFRAMPLHISPAPRLAPETVTLVDRLLGTRGLRIKEVFMNS
jgi:hypothetical protein